MAMVCGASAADHPRCARGGSGEEWRGRIWQPDRDRFRRWLHSDLFRRARGGRVPLAVEGCTGWRCVVEEIESAGFEAHLAEPADTQAARGRKHRAKTDRSDARLLRDLLAAGELPASWIPPAGVLEWRERVRLYVSLVNQRTVWCQRIHAELCQHGVAVPEGAIRAPTTRSMLADGDLALSPAGRERITVGYRMIDATDAEALPLKKELQRFAHCPLLTISEASRALEPDLTSLAVRSGLRGRPSLMGGARPGPRGRRRPASPMPASPTSLRRWKAGRWPDPGRRAPGVSGCGGAPLSMGRGGWDR